MKKIIYSYIAMFGIFSAVACSDMLEADSSRQLFDPELDQKTDSVSYAYGVMQAMQQLADQYYFQNEMRGELVSPTAKASTYLRDLSTFTADASNKYDSVYLYYKVINNCNYYLAHRDSSLMTGSRNVVINEYAGIASFRAWTYLQLARQYGDVPYVTEPVTTISQINANTGRVDGNTILAHEAAKLEELKSRYSEDMLSVPTFGQTSRPIGVLNWKNANNANEQKFINPSKCFIPLNVVLGDIYLELGRYEEAAKCYYQYLRYTGSIGGSFSVNYFDVLSLGYSDYNSIFKDLQYFPIDFNEKNQMDAVGQPVWENSFAHSSSPGDVISYIPMAVNYMMGKTTDVPAAFGYSYYATERKNEVATPGNDIFGCPKNRDIQVIPSQVYNDSARLARYYYYTEQSTEVGNPWIINSSRLGDARASIIKQGIGADTSCVYTLKPSTAYILLYRNATVWLHLAEAINRMGYPDAAFAVLKNGLHYGLRNFRYNPDEGKISPRYYLSPASYELLTTTLPFLAEANKSIFENPAKETIIGIHQHGAGIAVKDSTSTYRYDIVVGDKIADINAKFSLGLTPGAYTKKDSINAVEDLLCDEYAMEFAFEGTRFSDLRRLAIHKNQSGIYGGNFGDLWLSKKLQNNATGITTKNCYLPYK